MIKFTGELYNRQELAAALGMVGPDADLVKAAYDKWGASSFARLRGAFAFEIECGDRKILVRDQFGVVPFYYYIGKVNGRHGIFGATSVGALLAMGVPRRLSRKGLATCLAYGAVQHPWTMIQDVLCVLPATYVVYDERTGSVETECYWRSSFKARHWRRGELTEALSAALFKSVKSMVDYGGNPAAFLSGGIDSSSIAIMMRRMGSDMAVRTYCIRGEDPNLDERHWAHLVSERIQTTHRDLLLSDEDVRDHIEEAVASYDQPSVDGVNAWFGAKLMHDAGEVAVLSGQGGDELFMMYGEVQKVLLAYRSDRFVRWVPRFAGVALERFARNEKMRKLGQLIGRNVEPYFLVWRIFSEYRISKLVSRELVDLEGLRNPIDEFGGETVDIGNRISWLNLRNILADMYLRDGYQTSLPHRVSVRTPLLDVDLVELVYSTAGLDRYSLETPKPQLLDVCGADLPPECKTRRKRGFSLPFDRYLNGAVKERMDEFVNGNGSGIFNQKAVGELRRRYYDRHEIYWSNLWLPFMIDEWVKRNRVSF